VKKKDSKKIEELKHKARRKSIQEGFFSVAKSSFGDSYISPFAIAINASNSIVALLTSISGLIGPLVQIFSSRLIEKNSRKSIVLKALLGESLMWIPFILMGLLFYNGILLEFLPVVLLIVYSFYIIFANIASPAWFSWMGDVVDEEYRGRWFAKRNLLLGAVTIVLTIMAAFFLDYLKKNDKLILGFIILFSLAFIFRMIARHIFKKQYEPKIKLKKGYYFSFFEFATKLTKSNFGKFTIFRCLLSLASGVSTSLIAVYLLRNLEFNYVLYIAIILSGSFFSLILIKFWGSFADRFGNYKVIALTSILVPIVPILWVLHPSPIYLIFVPSLLSGVMWSGFNLATGNFIYDSVSQEKRGLVISYYNMINGIGIFLGAGIGAILIKYLTIELMEPIVAIFLISALLRMIVVFIFIPQIKEVRKTESIKSSRTMKNLILKELDSSIKQEAHELMSIKRYVFDK